jgi:mono/diheme cytochrome c family protein
MNAAVEKHRRGDQPAQCRHAQKERSMHTLKSCLLTAVALLVAALPAYAADAEHGLALAKRWCAACHVVSPDQREANADAPPFATIARSSFNAKTLAYFLLDPHPKMPELPLSRYAADDIAAYIESLKK